jgi:Domain of unknown function (DUF4304)
MENNQAKANSLILKEMVSSFFLDLGFKKKSNVWYRDYADVIVVFELIKSSWSYCYSLDSGIIIKFASDEKLKITTRHCHLYIDSIHLEKAVEKRRELYDLLDCHVDDVETNTLRFLEYFKSTEIVSRLSNLTTKEALLAYFKEFGYTGVLHTQFFLLDEFIQRLEA